MDKGWTLQIDCYFRYVKSFQCQTNDLNVFEIFKDLCQTKQIYLACMAILQISCTLLILYYSVFLKGNHHALVAGYYDIMLDVHVFLHLTVHLSYLRPSICISFPDNNLSKYQWIFVKLGIRIDIRRSGLGLLMGKFLQFLTELSTWDKPIFSFLEDNLSKSLRKHAYSNR